MSTVSDTMPSHLLERERSFQLLFYRNPVPMYIFDNSSLAILAVNDAAVEKYGWSRDEFTSMTIEQLRPPEELPALRAYRERMIAEPHSGLNYSVPWRQWTKDGALLHVETTWLEIPWDDKTGVLVSSVDRSKLKRAEDRAREQASLLDLAADAIIVRDLQNRVLYWNHGAERLYGWRAVDMVGRVPVELNATDPFDYEAAERVLLKDGLWSGEIEHRRRDGQTVIVNSRWTLVRDDRDRPKAVLVINTDITDTKKLERQFLRSQRVEAIGTLASGIAHDLNNVLTPILMSVGILRRSITDPEADKVLDVIECSAARGAGIVSQVVTFARGVEVDRTILQPQQIVAEVAKIISQTFPRNIDIQTQLPPESWTLSADATQIHQVLLNLCVNARDAMPAGGRLTIATENVKIDEHFARMNPGAQLGHNVVFRISDTGTGMSPDVVEKIFDPFFTTKEVGKGTGLGLATVIGIVKSHGGFLNVHSEPRVGTTFRVFVPASRDDPNTIQPPKPLPPDAGIGQRILVVDDELPIRQAIVRTLESSGYRAFTAEDGSDALALYFQRRSEIDIVLTDISMGGVDGVTLIRSLRKINPSVRVIVSSGHLNQENLHLLSSLGVRHFLDKPYTADRLLRAVHDALADASQPIAG